MTQAASQPSGAQPRPHVPVDQIRPHTYVDGTYSLVNPQVGTAKNGKHFLKAIIRDATGEIPVRQWTFEEAMLGEISRTGFVWIGGQAQEYNGQVQLIVDAISAVEVSVEDLTRLLPASRHDIASMEAELRRILGSLSNPAMRALADAYLSNEAFMARVRQAPAAISVHHAWIGGLLEHTLQLLRLAEVMLPFYPELNRDIVLLGLFLHDLGKTSELTWERGFSYTTEGNLIGHTVKGVIMLTALAAKSARDSGQRLALTQLVNGEHHGLHAGATDLADRGAGNRVRNTAMDRGLARRCLANRGRQHIAHVDFAHTVAGKLGPGQCRLHRLRAQERRRERGKLSLEAAHRRARHSRDIDIASRHRRAPWCNSGIQIRHARGVRQVRPRCRRRPGCRGSRTRPCPCRPSGPTGSQPRPSRAVCRACSQSTGIRLPPADAAEDCGREYVP